MSSKPLVTSDNQKIWHSPARTGSGDFQKEAGESLAERMAQSWRSRQTPTRCFFIQTFVPAYSRVKNSITLGELISGRLVSRALLGIVVAVQRVSSACTTAQRSSSACVWCSGVQFPYGTFSMAGRGGVFLYGLGPALSPESTGGKVYGQALRGKISLLPVQPYF